MVLALTSQMIEALEGGATPPEQGTTPVVHEFRFLLELRFKSATDYLWTGLGSIDWNGQTWTGGSSPVMQIGSFEINAQGDVPPIALNFAVADPAMLTTILATDEIPGRTAIIRVAIYDATAHALLPDPVNLIERRMRVGPYNRGNKVWSLLLEHPMAQALQRNVRTRSHRDQLEWASALGVANDQAFIDVTSVPDPRSRRWPAANWEQKRILP